MESPKRRRSKAAVISSYFDGGEDRILRLLSIQKFAVVIGRLGDDCEGRDPISGTSFWLQISISVHMQCAPGWPHAFPSSRRLAHLSSSHEIDISTATNCSRRFPQRSESVLLMLVEHRSSPKKSWTSEDFESKTRRSWTRLRSNSNLFRGWLGKRGGEYV